MRRVKSAPADLSKMSNNKRVPNSKITSSLIVLNQNQNRILVPEKKNKFKVAKIIKKDIEICINYISDIIVDLNHDTFNLEQESIVTSVFQYLSNDIFRKNTREYIYSFIIKSIVKYLIMLFIHTQFLHDRPDINNNLHNMLLSVVSN